MEWIGVGVAVIIGVAVYYLYGRDEGDLRTGRLRYGVTPRGALPLPVMSPEFEARLKERIKTEKRGVGIGMIFAVILASIVALLFPDMLMLMYILFCFFFFFGRAVADFIDRSRQLRQANPSKPRISRGRYVGLFDYFPLPYTIAGLLATALLNGVAIFGAREALAAPWKFALAIGVCVFFIVASWALAGYVARQPLYANSEADLRWEDRLIGEDIQTIPLLGASMPIVGLLPLIDSETSQGYIGLVALALVACFAALAIIAWLASSSSWRHLWPDPDPDSHGPKATNDKRWH